MKITILIFIQVFTFLSLNAQTLTDQDLKKFDVTRPELLNYNTQPRSPVEPIIIQGFVYDLTTKEPLPHAYVIVKGAKFGSQANAAGYYSLDISNAYVINGKISLQCGYINYKIREILIDKKENGFSDIGLENMPGIEQNEIPYNAKPSKN